VALALTSILAGLGFLAARIFKEAGGPVAVIFLVAMGVPWGLKKIAERYFLYLIKAGPVAVAYHDAVREQTPAYDLYGTLSGVSRSFRELEQRARQAPAPEPALA